MTTKSEKGGGNGTSVRERELIRCEREEYISFACVDSCGRERQHKGENGEWEREDDYC